MACTKRRNPEQHGSCEVYDISHSANQFESLLLGFLSAAMQGRHWAEDVLLSDTLYVECYHVQAFYINQFKKMSLLLSLSCLILKDEGKVGTLFSPKHCRINIFT